MLKSSTLILLLCCLSLTISAQQTYQLPPQEIINIVDAARPPSLQFNDDATVALVLYRSEMPSIAEIAAPELRLAGLRINPRNNGPSRGNYFVGAGVRTLADTAVHRISGLPTTVRLGNTVWSPDEKYVAMTNSTETGIELWLLDVTKASAKRLGDINCNAAIGNPIAWAADSKSLLIRAVPPKRSTPPTPSFVPAGPTVQENLGKKSPARTYQDLLKNASDEIVFEYHATAQLLKITLDGKFTPFATPGIITNASYSPDGKYVMVRRVHKPYSYLVTLGSFPTAVEIYTADGKLVKTIADIPLQESVPTGFNAVPNGPRSHAWRPDQAACIAWVEAQDGGDPKAKADIRDRVYVQDAPFTAPPREVFATKLRYGGITWGTDNFALAYESWWAFRREVTTVFDPSGSAPPRILFDRSSEDTYTDPGNPELTRNTYHKYTLQPDQNGEVVMFGDGASDDGERPFVDMLNINTGKTRRLWRSEAPFYEVPFSMIAGNNLITTRQSTEKPANYFVRNLTSGELKQITYNPHPYPQLAGLKKQVLKFYRADSIEMTADLYLPIGYTTADGPLPTFVWAYPAEFKSKAAASQITGSPYQFSYVSGMGMIPLITQGYAVLDNASMPIVGEGDKEPNDNFIEQLTMNAEAIINEGARLGVTDPKRVAVGGHSYGAFMTANLLAHSDLFRTGIARSGAYNRTLTPFGFQAEERTYWQAPEVYNDMSPFNFADKIKAPIMLIHGEADNNPGTFPIQSERFYNALKGHGATARYVVLPAEAHGYVARESILHMWWEMNTWLETYCKSPK